MANKAKANYNTKTQTANTGYKCRSKFPDSSTGLKRSPSVNDGATRGATAPTPKSLGPRKDGM